MALSKIQRGFHAFQKNTGSFHPSDKQRTMKRSTGSLELTDDGALWHGTISVGTPPVAFTGSSDLFLPGSSCSVNCEGHAVYDTDKSSTAKNLSKNFSLSFADGSVVQGVVFTDTVSIANLTATSQAIGVAARYSAGFAEAQFPPDGLMGMAFPQISEFSENPVFQSLVAQNETTAPQFSFKLSETQSELLLGGVNTDLFSGTLTQVPVVQKGFWQVKLDAVNVAGNETSTGLSAVVDTGTTMVLGDVDSVRSLYAAIPGSADASNTVGAGFFSFPCSASSDVSLTFGGKSFAISPDTFNLGRISQNSADCVGGVVGAADLQFWIVGDLFLQNVYTVFDVGSSSVGFANLS
ncbi:hypothetical protein DXG01_005810 [Tephrocybe rancida]|nr:hypothetical protein DXG01_005810 [Tephrocybe rancida]